MKFVIYFICLISIILCQPRSFNKERRRMQDEKESKDIKKSILECISKDVKASLDLKQYVMELLKKDNKEILHFEKFQENDRNIVKQCRKKAFFTKLSIKPIIRKNETKIANK